MFLLPFWVRTAQAIASLAGPLIWPWLRTWKRREAKTALMLREELTTSGSAAPLPSFGAKTGRGGWD